MRRLGIGMGMGAPRRRGGAGEGGGGDGGGFDFAGTLTERWSGAVGVFEDAGTDAAEDGDEVHTWVGANGLELVSYSTRLPSWDETNGAIVFNRSNSEGMRVLDSTDLGTGLHHSVHFVLDVTDAASNPQMLFQSSAIRVYLRINTWPYGVAILEEGGGTQYFGHTLGSGLQLLSFEMNDADGEISLYVNNVQRGSTKSYAGTAWDENIYWFQLDIMNRNNVGQWATGSVRDIGVLTSADAISSDDRAAIRAAFMTEHSL